MRASGRPKRSGVGALITTLGGGIDQIAKQTHKHVMSLQEVWTQDDLDYINRESAKIQSMAKEGLRGSLPKEQLEFQVDMYLKQVTFLQDILHTSTCFLEFLNGHETSPKLNFDP